MPAATRLRADGARLPKAFLCIVDFLLFLRRAPVSPLPCFPRFLRPGHQGLKVVQKGLCPCRLKDGQPLLYLGSPFLSFSLRLKRPAPQYDTHAEGHVEPLLLGERQKRFGLLEVVFRFR